MSPQLKQMLRNAAADELFSLQNSLINSDQSNKYHTQVTLATTKIFLSHGYPNYPYSPVLLARSPLSNLFYKLTCYLYGTIGYY